jgi:hypothetical protein
MTVVLRQPEALPLDVFGNNPVAARCLTSSYSGRTWKEGNVVFESKVCVQRALENFKREFEASRAPMSAMVRILAGTISIAEEQAECFPATIPHVTQFIRKIQALACLYDVEEVSRDAESALRRVFFLAIRLQREEEEAMFRARYPALQMSEAERIALHEKCMQNPLLQLDYII